MSSPSEGAPAISSKRARSSPEVSLRATKKSQADKEMEPPGLANSPEFMATLKGVMSSLFDEKLAPLATMESVEGLRNEILTLKEEHNDLKLKFSAMKRSYDDKLENMEVQLRRNNLIIRGLKYQHSEDCELAVKTFTQEVLKTELRENLFHASPVGPKDNTNRPILMTFNRYQDKLDVLKATKVLRGTGITIQQDLPISVRHKQKKLLVIRKEILRSNPSLQVRVRANSLIINNYKFSWSHDLGLLYGELPGSSQLSDLVGVDMSAFLDLMLADSLPADYFERSSSSSNGSRRSQPVPVSAKAQLD